MMIKKYTLIEICNSKQLWMEYIDPSGGGTRGEDGDEFKEWKSAIDKATGQQDL